MAASEWLRTFVAIYRSGSVSAGAAQRSLSQPAASQQLASLERRIGLPLFIRTAHGVEPTRRGRELHAQVAESLDRLEQVLVGLDGGTGQAEPAAIRSARRPSSSPRPSCPGSGPAAPPLAARFGPDDVILDLLATARWTWP